MKDGWECLPLGEVCGIYSRLVDPTSRTFRDLPHVGGANIVSESGQLIDIRSASEEGLTSGKYLFDNDTVLYSKIRPYLKKVARPQFSGLCSADVYPLTPAPERLTRDYLYWLLLSEDFTTYATSGSARAGMPKVNRRHLFSYPTPVPPLAEQERIVSILDSALARLNQLTAVTETELRLLGSMEENFLSGVVGEGREDWRRMSIGDDCDLLPGYAFPSRSFQDGPPGVRLLRGDNLAPRTLRWEGAKWWPMDDAQEYAKFGIEPGDIVLGMDRPWIASGLRIAEVSSDDCPALLVQRVLRLRFGRTWDRRFAFHRLRCRDFTEHLLRGQTGVGVPHISGKQVQSFGLLLPSLETQRRLAKTADEFLSHTKSLAVGYERKLALVHEVRASLLQRAFAGEL